MAAIAWVSKVLMAESFVQVPIYSLLSRHTSGKIFLSGYLVMKQNTGMWIHAFPLSISVS